LKKYIKAVLLIIVYTIIYLAFMLICEIVFGLTLGGGYGELAKLLQETGAAGQPQIREAAYAAAEIVNAYMLRNSGIILSISALLSLLTYTRIYSARKMSLFSVLNMDRRPAGADLKNGIFAGVSVNFVISFVFVLLQNFKFIGDALSNYNAQMETAFGAGGVAQNLLGIGIIGPLVEEILFRGMIKRELESVSKWKAAVVVQGVLFGLYHFIPLQIIYTIPIGIYLGYITYKTGSVWPAAAGHIALNSLSVLLTAPGIAEVFGSPQFSLLFIVFSVYMFASSLRYFLKREPDRPENGASA